MMLTVTFSPNVPQQLAFKAEGEFETGRAGDTVRYDLVDGRTLHLAPDVAAKVFLMEVQPLETFFICKYWNGEKKQAARWNVWLSPQSEQARAAEEEAVVAITPEPVSPAPPPVPKPAILKRTPPPLPLARPAPIPWNVAFREISAFVARELKANDLQWSDEAQQATCCTVLIAEAKAGRIGPWERAQ